MVGCSVLYKSFDKIRSKVSNHSYFITEFVTDVNLCYENGTFKRNKIIKIKMTNDDKIVIKIGFQFSSKV